MNHLARDRGVAASTQNQALASLLFLYKEVLAVSLPWLDGLDRVRKPGRVPAVLTASEVQRLLAHLKGDRWLMASLLYGAGLRLRECLKLRVTDVMNKGARGVKSPLDRLEQPRAAYRILTAGEGRTAPRSATAAAAR